MLMLKTILQVLVPYQQSLYIIGVTHNLCGFQECDVPNVDIWALSYMYYVSYICEDNSSVLHTFTLGASSNLITLLAQPDLHELPADLVMCTHTHTQQFQRLNVKNRKWFCGPESLVVMTDLLYFSMLVKFNIKADIGCWNRQFIYFTPEDLPPIR